jgi:hypothetical protein
VLASLLGMLIEGFIGGGRLELFDSPDIGRSIGRAVESLDVRGAPDALTSGCSFDN